MADEPEWYEQLLDAQLRTNAQTWEQLEQQGVADGRELQLGFIYLAPGRDEAEQLANFLLDETDYEVESREQKEEWFVFGVTRPTPVSRELLDQWVEWMVAAGAAEGPCAFDGWEVVGGLPAAPGE